LVTCCSSCNLRKGNKSVEEVGFKMSKKPFVPSVFSFVVNDEVESIWDNFKTSFV
jgi:5-methylcytosine-specific restriction endonuclease McrA